MRLSYHLLINAEQLHKITDWQLACLEYQLPVHFDTDLNNYLPNTTAQLLRLHYQNHSAEISTYISPASDVKDICDDLTQYLDDKQTIAIHFDFNGDATDINGVTIAISVLTSLMNGILYIEGDGQILTAIQALENAKTIALSAS